MKLLYTSYLTAQASISVLRGAGVLPRVAGVFGTVCNIHKTPRKPVSTTVTLFSKVQQ